MWGEMKVNQRGEVVVDRRWRYGKRKKGLGLSE